MKEAAVDQQEIIDAVTTKKANASVVDENVLLIFRNLRN